MASYRSFIAFTLPETIRQYCSSIQQQLKKTAGIKASWVNPSNFHMTILFLGERSIEELNEISGFISEQKTDLTGVGFQIESVSVFGKPPRILYLSITDSGMKARHIAEGVIKAFGSEKEKKQGWTPHITLARIKTDRPGEVFGVKTNRILFAPEALVLFTSTLTVNGAIHTPYVKRTDWR